MPQPILWLNRNSALYFYDPRVINQHAQDLVAIDFFLVPTPTLRVLFVFVILAHDRRRIVHFNVTEDPTAQWTAQQLLEAFPYQCGATSSSSTSGISSDSYRRIWTTTTLGERTSPWTRMHRRVAPYDQPNPATFSSSLPSTVSIIAIFRRRREYSGPTTSQEDLDWLERDANLDRSSARLLLDALPHSRCVHTDAGIFIEHDAEAGDIVARLEREHGAFAEKGNRFLEMLRHVVDGALVERDVLEDTGRDFIGFLRSHMEIEDSDAFPRAERALTDADWQEVESDMDARTDPVFGPVITNEFRSLYDYIQRES